MTFLPIVGRELRLAARRPATFLLRAAAAALVVLVGIWCYLAMRWRSPEEKAQSLFYLLAGSVTLFALLSGVRSTADCISEEKREGTLGLLFLTDLKGYDVVLGKLAACSLNSLYGLLAVVPMLAIPLLMGGIAPGEVARLALVAIITLFFSLALGLCISVFAQSARKAVAFTLFALLVFTALMPLLAGVLARRDWLNQNGALGLCSLSPGACFAFALESPYRSTQWPFWLSVALIHGLTWLFLGLASLFLPRTWQERPLGARGLRWRERLRLLTLGNPAQRAAFRKRLLDQNAFFWLASRPRFKPSLVWIVLAIGACGWSWGALKIGRDWFDPWVYVVTCVSLNLLIKGWFAGEVGQQLIENRQSGTLELLLSTPLSLRDILEGQRMALMRQFLGPIMVTLGVFLACLAGSISRHSPEDNAIATAFFLALIVMLVADLIALYWVGLWQAMTARSPRRAAQGTLARILALPDAVFLIVLIAMKFSSPPVLGEKTALCLWIGLGFLADLAFGLWARENLMTQFRAAAEHRPGSRARASL